ncbi:MAG: DNA ligase D [Bacteroidota bacterium]
MGESTASKKLILKGIKAPMPDKVSPMLCTLTKAPVSDAAYLHEVKWDGYRIVSYSNKGAVRMDSRSSLDYTKKYPLLVQAIKSLKHDLLLDGEVVVINAEGRPDFDALQKYNGHHTPIFYYVFDLLWLDGYSLVQLPLTDRKAILKEIVAGNDCLKFSESFEDANALFNELAEREMEGIVSKIKNSTYQPGARNTNWLKTPSRKRQEFVIGGWVESDRGRPFASLLFGAYNNNKLEWIGHGGGGFKEKEMPGILKQLQALEIKRSPFVNEPDTGGRMHWAKPELVANFEFATWTKSGRIRKPAIFLGFRKDKKAKDVVREVPAEETEVPEEQPKKPVMVKATANKKRAASEASNWPEIERQAITSEQDFQIDDCTIRISNIEKEIWEGVTKAGLVTYYHEVAHYMLPYIQNRPQSLHVKLHGVHAPGLYIKDMEGRQPECADIFTTPRKHPKPGMRNMIDYLVCNNEATLLWMINLGCIDVNPWTSQTANPEQPNYLIIDLDPSDSDFKKAIETALAAKQYFDDFKLKTFVKTSGKTGMHIYIPCIGFNFKQARSLAEKICIEISSFLPDITTTIVNIEKRGSKLFVDFSQNDFADTVAAPYSVRPNKAGPIVSTPLQWKEVKPGLDPGDFTIHTILKRLMRKGDLFAGVMDKKIAVANSKVLSKMFYRDLQVKDKITRAERNYT